MVYDLLVVKILGSSEETCGCFNKVGEHSIDYNRGATDILIGSANGLVSTVLVGCGPRDYFGYNRVEQMKAVSIIFKSPWHKAPTSSKCPR